MAAYSTHSAFYVGNMDDSAFQRVIIRKRPFWVLLPLAGVNVLVRSGAGSVRTTLWIALTTTRRVSDIAGSRF